MLLLVLQVDPFRNLGQEHNMDRLQELKDKVMAEVAINAMFQQPYTLITQDELDELEILAQQELDNVQT